MSFFLLYNFREKLKIFLLKSRVLNKIESSFLVNLKYLFDNLFIKIFPVVFKCNLLEQQLLTGSSV